MCVCVPSIHVGVLWGGMGVTTHVTRAMAYKPRRTSRAPRMPWQRHPARWISGPALASSGCSQSAPSLETVPASEVESEFSRRNW